MGWVINEAKVCFNCTSGIHTCSYKLCVLRGKILLYTCNFNLDSGYVVYMTTLFDWNAKEKREIEKIQFNNKNIINYLILT